MNVPGRTADDVLNEAADLIAATLPQTDPRAWRRLLIYCPNWLILERVEKTMSMQGILAFSQSASKAERDGLIAELERLQGIFAFSEAASKAERDSLTAEIERLRAALEEIASWVLPTGTDAQDVALRALGVLSYTL